jgi:magnesium chelatase family protein
MPIQPVKIGCGAIRGVDAVPVVLEVSLQNGTGTPRILGLADAGVREAYYRILGAFGAQGIPPPRGVPTINFTPATVRKTGSGFDLPMALGLAAANGQFDSPSVLAAVGEVSLSGDILPTPGVVSVALAARERGWTHLLTDTTSARVAALVPGVRSYGVATLRDALRFLRGEAKIPPAEPPSPRSSVEYQDLADIRGHETPKTAMMVAAAGRHNLLMVGPPGSGKTALVQRLPGLLPPTTEEEALEVLKIHTVSCRGNGSLPDHTRRPVRCPHHTSSSASLLGGGTDPRPGEVTLAQHGVLFLDELPEFRREVLEGLRQPLEDGQLTIGRVRQTVTMPADFLLVCAMNPCQCGYHGHGQRPCVCNPGQRQRYRSRISGPLLDRLDLQIEVPALPPSELHRPSDPKWSTARVRDRVLVAVDRQRQRNRRCPAWPNGRLRDAALEDAVGTSDDIRHAVEDVLRIHSMSGRARVRLLRIARTIADLDDRDNVLIPDIHAAARLRGYGSII